MNTLVRNREIAIDPAATITWQTCDAISGDGGIGELRGNLYVAPTLPNDIDPVQLFSNFVHNVKSYARIGSGDYGSVYAANEDLAIKRFTLPKSGDIKYLRPNVILAEGLKETLTPSDFPVSIRGLEIYAAYVPTEMKDWGGASNQPLWLMERIHHLSDNVPIPFAPDEENFYKEVVAPYGVPAKSIYFDVKRDNLLLEDIPANPDHKPKTVKIDVIPDDDLFKNY